MSDGPSSTPEVLQHQEAPRQYTEVRQIIPVTDVPLLSRAAQGMNIGVHVLKNQGEEYHMRAYNSGMKKVMNNGESYIVPDAHSFVLISGATDPQIGLKDYWKEVERIRQERDQQPT